MGVIWPKLVVWNWKGAKGLNFVFAGLELVVVHLKKIRKIINIRIHTTSELYILIHLVHPWHEITRQPNGLVAKSP